MNADIFIPARLDSKRLPEKHLLQINGKPILKYLIERLQTSKKIRNIIVCTTNSPTDEPLVNFLEHESIMYFRGSENDILDRFLKTATKYDTDIIVDVEGDDFFTDPLYVDKIVSEMQNTDVDFITGNSSAESFDSNSGFPHGLVPMGIRTKALKKICQLKITNNTETGYKEFFMIPNLFKCKYLFPESKITFPENLRLTIDYKEDFELAKKIISELGNDFNFSKLLELFQQQPDLFSIVDPVIDKWKKNYQKNIPDLSLNPDYK